MSFLSTFSYAKELDGDPVTLGNTEMRPFHSDVSGRDYLLYIGYPDSYHSSPDRRYPVIYLTDGYWSFVKFYSLGSNLWYDKAAPEYILVGLGYDGEGIDYEKERAYELSPTKLIFPQLQGIKGETGGSPLFLRSIKEEIIPYIEAETRADSAFRVLAGNSLGGLFDLYAMYEEPELFQGIIAGSPAVQWDMGWIYKHAKEFEENGAEGDVTLNTSLYMTVGGNEFSMFQNKVKKFNKYLEEQSYKGFRYKFRVIDGEGHGSSVAETFNRGIRFVFESYKPSKK
jgi:hypothetical protein